MGVNASKSLNKGQDLVDLGSVFPNGLYKTATEQDYDTRALTSLIKARKLAPFYKGNNKHKKKRH
jgi:hypothetical protein